MPPRTLNKLTSRTVETKRKPGRYGDGGGLYLQVSPTGSKAWVFRYMLAGITVSGSGKPLSREMGLGSVRDISLNEAREAAGLCRKALQAKIDPIQARDDTATQERLQAARATTFREAAKAHIDAHRAGWRNAKHASQWENTLETYAYPTIGDLPVQDVDTGLVMKVLEPLWTKKTETATRVRGRIEVVLDSAKVKGQRTGENPARWRGHLDKLLPKRSKVQKVEHHPALPYAKIPAFMEKLRKMEGTAPRALEFTILSAPRTNETCLALPDEFNLDTKVWTIPEGRMKGEREHRVPLSPRAVAIVREMLRQKGEFVFPGGRKGKPLSNGGMMAVLKRMGHDDITVHGFRSTFRDWASEVNNTPNHVAEAALAHVVGDKVEAAYRRGDLFMKRRKLMDDWARYCESEVKQGKVVQMPGARKG